MRGDYRFAAVTVTAGVFILAVPLAGARARLVSCALVNLAAAGAVTFDSSGDAITGTMTLIAGGVLVLPFAAEGWMQTAVGAALRVVASGTVAGCVVYEYIPDTP